MRINSPARACKIGHDQIGVKGGKKILVSGYYHKALPETIRGLRQYDASHANVANRALATFLGLVESSQEPYAGTDSSESMRQFDYDFALRANIAEL